MEKVKVKICNYLVLLLVLIICIGANVIKNQKVEYDIAGGSDCSVDIEPGDVLIQTYMPNRKNIIGIKYRLSEEQIVNGTYRLVLSYGLNYSDNPVFDIENVYDGQSLEELYFSLPERYTPHVGNRLYIFLLSNDNNSEVLSVSADSTFKSYYRINHGSADISFENATLDIVIQSIKGYKWFLGLSIMLYTVGLTFLLMYLLKSNFSNTLPVTLILIVLISYLLGMIGHLYWANSIIYYLSLLGVALYVIDCNKQKVFVVKKLDLSTFMWAVSVIILFFIVKHTYIGDPDSIFYINKCKYMFWSDTLAFSSSYAFFFPTLAYLFQCVNGIFTEDMVLFAIVLYEAAIVFSFMNCIKVSNKVLSAVLNVFIIIIGVSLTIEIQPNSIMTVMMDVPFSMTLSYILKLIYEEDMDKKTFVLLAFSFIAAVMIKRAGVPALLIISILFVVHSIRVCKKNSRCLLKNIFYIFVLLALSIFVYKAIDIYTEKAQTIIETPGTVDFVAESVSESDSLVETNQRLTATNIIVIKNLLNAFFEKKIYGPLTYFSSLAFLFSLSAFVWLYKKTDSSLNYFFNSIELIAAALIYYAIISYKYLFAIEEQNKTTLNAFDRYAIHFIGAIVIYLAVSGIRELLLDKSEKFNEYRIVIGVVAFASLLSIIVDYEGIDSWIKAEHQLIEETDYSLNRALTIYAGYDHGICVYAPSDTIDEVGYYGKDLNLNSWPVGITIVNAVIDRKLSNAFLDYLSNNFEYLYLVNYDDSFCEIFDENFDHNLENCSKHAIYRIDKTNDGKVFFTNLGQIALNDSLLVNEGGMINDH